MQAMMVVVFGAPGTGKTTLLDELINRSPAAECPYHFVTIDEPTSQAAIAEKLRVMYNESEADIAAGKSVAAQVQTMIMEARIADYQDFMKYQLVGAQRYAQENGKTLIVVCDGHVLTDDKLYVRSKYDAGQISAAQFDQFTMHKEQKLADVAKFFSTPGVYIQLTIDNDESGAKHHHRVCLQRGNATESNVPPGVFARLARYADSTFKQLNDTAEGCVAKLPTDRRTPTEVCDEFMSIIAQTLELRERKVHNDPVDWYTGSIIIPRLPRGETVWLAIPKGSLGPGPIVQEKELAAK